MRTTRFWNNLYQVRSMSENWTPNNFKKFGNKYIKGTKQNCLNRLRLTFCWGRKYLVLIIITLLRNRNFHSKNSFNKPCPCGNTDHWTIVVLIKYTHRLYNHMQMFDHFYWKYIPIISHLHIIVTGQICIMLTKVILFTSA